MMADSSQINKILSLAEARFGNGDDGVFVYNSVPGQNNGTTLQVDQYGNIGPGIDCSGLVYQALLAAGYNVGSQRLTTANFVAGSQFETVSAADVQAGDIVTFLGHVGVVISFDPATGTGQFYGSQTSTGPAVADFSINGGAYWGGDAPFITFLQPKSSIYDPQGAAEILQPLTNQENNILEEIGAPTISLNLPVDPSDASSAASSIAQSVYAESQSADANGDIGISGITPAQATALANQWKNAFSRDGGTISSFVNTDNGVAAVSTSGTLYQLNFDGSWSRTNQNTDGSALVVSASSSQSIAISATSAPDANGNCITSNYTISAPTGPVVTNSGSTLSVSTADGTYILDTTTGAISVPGTAAAISYNGIPTTIDLDNNFAVENNNRVISTVVTSSTSGGDGTQYVQIGSSGTGDLEVDQFGDEQSDGIAEAEHYLEFGAGSGIEQSSDFVGAKDPRQLVGATYLFGYTEHGLPWLGDGLEEADTGNGLVDGSDRHAAACQFEAEEAKIFGRRLVGWTVDELGETFDAVDIGHLGRGRKAVQGHIVDQALSQGADGPDGRRGHWGLLLLLRVANWTLPFSRQKGSRRYHSQAAAPRRTRAAPCRSLSDVGFRASTPFPHTERFGAFTLQPRLLRSLIQAMDVRR
jgi:hypothetical protein